MYRLLSVTKPLSIWKFFFFCLFYTEWYFIILIPTGSWNVIYQIYTSLRIVFQESILRWTFKWIFTMNSTQWDFLIYTAIYGKKGCCNNLCHKTGVPKLWAMFSTGPWKQWASMHMHFICVSGVCVCTRITHANRAVCTCLPLIGTIPFLPHWSAKPEWLGNSVIKYCHVYIWIELFLTYCMFLGEKDILVSKWSPVISHDFCSFFGLQMSTIFNVLCTHPTHPFMSCSRVTFFRRFLTFKLLPISPSGSSMIPL